MITGYLGQFNTKVAKILSSCLLQQRHDASTASTGELRLPGDPLHGDPDVPGPPGSPSGIPQQGIRDQLQTELPLFFIVCEGQEEDTELEEPGRLAAPQHHPQSCVGRAQEEHAGT